MEHTVYRIKNNLRDNLNNKYILLNVKNHTKKLDYFPAKDKKDFNNYLMILMILEQLDERLNTIFLIESQKENNNDKKNNAKDELKKIKKMDLENF